VVPTPGSNTGPATLALNGGAANNIVDGIGGPLGAGALGPGGIALLGWDGTNWRSVLGGAGSALGYVPVNKAGDTMTGMLTVPTVFTVNSTGVVGNYAQIVGRHLTVPPTTANPVITEWSAVAYDGTANGSGSAISLRSETNWAVGNHASNITFLTIPINSATQAFAGRINGDQTWLSQRGFRANLYTLTPAAGAAITVDFTGSGALPTAGTTGQAIQITLAGNLTLSNVLVPQGAMMRIVFQSTNLGTVTWPGYVIWPLGVAPNLAAGTQKYAIVTLVNAGAWVLGNASAY